MRKRSIELLKQLWLALPLMLSLCILSACSSDDDEIDEGTIDLETRGDHGIIGSWSLIDAVYFGPAWVLQEDDVIYTFSEDNTFTVKSDLERVPFLAPGTYQYSIDTENHIFMINGETNYYHYDGNSLRITQEGAAWDAGGSFHFIRK